MCELYNSCGNVWAGNACNGATYQRMCRDCNGNVWVRMAENNACVQRCYAPCRQSCRCACSQGCANAVNAANAGFGACARQNTCSVTATEDGYSYQCNTYCNN